MKWTQTLLWAEWYSPLCRGPFLRVHAALDLTPFPPNDDWIVVFRRIYFPVANAQRWRVQRVKTARESAAAPMSQGRDKR
jgi:hypothetical protein